MGCGSSTSAPVQENQSNKPAVETYEEYTVEEVAKHAVPSDLWTIIDGSVYNLSKFAVKHEGGIAVLLDWAGKDGTVEFDKAMHSRKAMDEMKEYKIGTVKGAVASEGKETYDEYTLKVTEVIRKSHDSCVYVLEAEDGGEIPVIPVANHVRIFDADKRMRRKYSPIFSDNKQMDILLKSYPKGMVSKYVAELPIGGTLCVAGPIPSVEGFKMSYISGDHVFLICMGTGIAPMIQIIREKTKDFRAWSSDTKIHIIYGSRTEADVLMKDELMKMMDDETVGKHFTLTFAISQNKDPLELKYSVKGRITIDMIKERMPQLVTINPTEDKYHVFVCGSNKFRDSLTEQLQAEFKIPDDKLYSF